MKIASCAVMGAITLVKIVSCTAEWAITPAAIALRADAGELIARGRGRS
jgi:hypothetical protein